MKYINLTIDVKALKNNGLHVYERTDDGLKKIESGQFVIADERAQLPCDFRHPDYILKEDVTPKQFNNIIFFETLKAFRR